MNLLDNNSRSLIYSIFNTIYVDKQKRKYKNFEIEGMICRSLYRNISYYIKNINNRYDSIISYSEYYTSFNYTKVGIYINLINHRYTVFIPSE